MNKFNILNTSVNIYTDSMLERASPKTSNWLQSFRNVPKTFTRISDKVKIVNDYLSKREYDRATEVLEMDVFSQRDIRGCPGMRNLLQKSVMLKFPFSVEVAIHADEDQGIVSGVQWKITGGVGAAAYTPQGMGVFEFVDQHALAQYRNNKGESFYQGYGNVKITLPILINTDKPTQFMFIEPFLHNTSVPDYKIIPGVLESNKNHIGPIVIQTMFPAKNRVYFFEQGTPICYLTCVSEKLFPKINEVENTEQNRTAWFKKSTKSLITSLKI